MNIVNNDEIFRSVIVGRNNLFTLKPQCVENVAKSNKNFIPFMNCYSELVISEDNCCTRIHPVLIDEAVQEVIPNEDNAVETSKNPVEEGTDTENTEIPRRCTRSKTTVKSQQKPTIPIVAISMTPKVSKPRAPYGSKSQKKLMNLMKLS